MDILTKKISIAFNILDLADRYHIDIYKHLGISYLKPDKMMIVDHIFSESGELNNELIFKIGEIFGLAPGYITCGGEDGLHLYYNKYKDFFTAYDEYLNRIEEASGNISSDKEVFILFPEIDKLISGFSVLCNRYKELFLTALRRELSHDEWLEMNFLAHFLEVKDVFITESYLTYEVVRNRRELYTEEIIEFEWYNIFLFHRLIDFKPWICKEFVESAAAEMDLNSFDVLWLNSMLDWLHNIDSGASCHFCWGDEFECDIKLVENNYEYIALYETDNDMADEVIEWLEFLNNMSNFWYSRTHFLSFCEAALPTAKGFERLGKRKQFIG